ncbi:MAG: 50S ribosomal protein L22 [Clostridia bacterium]|nr:50S ribosomal protein L22 [Clostridia bacterium]
MEAKNEAKAVLRYARISPRKVKIVIDLIRNKSVAEAIGIINNTQKAASEYLIKLLNSAVANAVNNNGMDPEKLYVAETYANAGPILKRIMPRAQGRAFRIRKRTSHITIVLKER